MFYLIHLHGDASLRSRYLLTFSTFSHRASGLTLNSGDAFTLKQLEDEEIEILIYKEELPEDSLRFIDFMQLFVLVKGKYRSDIVELQVTVIRDEKNIKVSDNQDC